MNRIHQYCNFRQIRSEIDISRTVFSPKKHERHGQDEMADQLVKSAEKRKQQIQDFKDALDFAQFIGLSPVKQARRRCQNMPQRFLRAHNFNLQNQKLKGKQVVKNSLQNRKINFFDMKKLWQQRCNVLKLQNYKYFQQKKRTKSQNDQKMKQRRVYSEKNVILSSSYAIQNFNDLIESDHDLKNLRIKTMRQINTRQKQKQQKQIDNFVKKVQSQKIVRSNILKDISKEQFTQSNQGPELHYQGWKKTHVGYSKQKGVSTLSKPQKYNNQSQMTKQNSTKGSPSAKLSVYNFHFLSKQLGLINPEKQNQQKQGENKSKHSKSPILRTRQKSTCIYLTPRQKSPSKQLNSKIIIFSNSPAKNAKNKKTIFQRADQQTSIPNKSQMKICYRNCKKTRLRLNKHNNIFQCQIK